MSRQSRVFSIIAVTAVVLFLIAWAGVRQLRVAMMPIEEMLGLINAHSLYVPDENGSANIKACMEKRAAAGLRVIGGKEPGGCFPEDKSAHYITPTEYAAYMKDATEDGRWSGVGIEFELSPDKKALIVEKLTPTGPAEKSGRLFRGDRIVGVSDEDGKISSFDGLTLPAMLELVGGPEGSTTIFVVKREDALVPVRITSETMNENVIVKHDAFGIGYLKLGAFWPEDVVKEEVEHRLDALAEKGIRHLAIDLRGNHGGSIEAAANLLALFAPEDKMLLVVAGYRQDSYEEYQTYNAALRGKWADWKLAVLVDEQSASASEIVASILKKWGAIIVGTETMGKGTVQPMPFPLSDGGALILTVGQYYFSNMEPLRGGVVPDVKVKIHCFPSKEIKIGEVVEKSCFDLPNTSAHTYLVLERTRRNHAYSFK